jgi:hypothetical protein
MKPVCCRDGTPWTRLCRLAGRHQTAALQVLGDEAVVAAHPAGQEVVAGVDCESVELDAVR